MPAALETRVAIREIPAPPPWRGLLERVRAAPGFWLLESALPTQRLGRFSFAGADPYLVMRAFGDRLELDVRRPVRPDLPPGRVQMHAHPLDALRSWLPRAAEPGEPDAPPFAGGAVGWIGYELAAALEGVIAFPGLDDLRLPDLMILFCDRALAFDAGSGRLFATALGFGSAARDRAERAAERLAERVARGARDPFEGGAAARADPRAAPAPSEPLRLRDAATGVDLGAFFDEGTYAKAVARVKERIAAGDVYQANLTHRLAFDRPGDAWTVYGALRRRNPAPFAAFLALPEIALIGSSPERFLRVEADGRVESRPIKGTRPRGRSPAEDRSLRAALASSEKDRAENVMIVDLVRNDLGRVCRTGSVAVPELLAVEEYATVFQLVSTVSGQLDDGLGALDALRAAFPPGSMTGAPKIAALQILAELEPVRRGPYAGALGYFDARGGADLCVVIRTILHRPERAWLHVGGGVVADSDPAAEWCESLDKARALLDALAETRP
jgi:para-aminobenzoate synthetase component I